LGWLNVYQAFEIVKAGEGILQEWELNERSSGKPLTKNKGPTLFGSALCKYGPGPT